MNRRTLLIAVLALALPACESEGTTDTELHTSYVGTYTLQTFNGQNLPVTIEGDVLTAGTAQLKDDLTWSVTLTSHHPDGTDASFHDHGTYVITGTALTITSADDGAVTHGVFSGTTLTMDGDDGIYVLKKN